jgi:Na+/H+-dicarboxylate symporter
MDAPRPPRGLWRRMPLYARILIAMFFGAIAGLALNAAGYTSNETTEAIRLLATLTMQQNLAFVTWRIDSYGRKSRFARGNILE